MEGRARNGNKIQQITAGTLPSRVLDSYLVNRVKQRRREAFL